MVDPLFLHSFQMATAVADGLGVSVGCHCCADDTSKVNKEVAVGLINNHRGGSKDVDLVQVISAFDVPKAKFDSIRRTFLRDETPTTLFGSAQVYRCRVHLCKCTRRNAVPISFALGKDPASIVGSFSASSLQDTVSLIGHVQ